MELDFFQYIILLFGSIVVAVFFEYAHVIEMSYKRPDDYEEYCQLNKIIGPFTVGSLVRDLIVIIGLFFSQFLAQYILPLIPSLSNKTYFLISICTLTFIAILTEKKINKM